jgi:hypothetical protein
MKKRIILFILIIIAKTSFSQNYIFFLHNNFIEEKGLEGIHPQYGKAEYLEIVEAFKKENFKVISEIRQKNTDVKTYAKKVVLQLDSLIKKGVSPSHITVIGTSKGGYIAMYVSSYLKNANVNFVFIASCSQVNEFTPLDLNFCGNILSIHEKSDTPSHSCLELKNKSTNTIPHFKEIELNTGLKHGFLFKAMQEWIRPCVLWGNQQYD